MILRLSFLLLLCAASVASHEKEPQDAQPTLVDRSVPRLTECIPEECPWQDLTPGMLRWCDCCRYCSENTNACMGDNLFCIWQSRCSELEICKEPEMQQRIYDLDLDQHLTGAQSFTTQQAQDATTTTTIAPTTTTTATTQQVQMPAPDETCQGWNGFCAPLTTMCPMGAQIVPQVPCNKEQGGFNFLCCVSLSPQTTGVATTTQAASTTSEAASTTTEAASSTTQSEAAVTAEAATAQEIEASSSTQGPALIIAEPQHGKHHGDDDDDDSSPPVSDHDDDDDDNSHHHSDNDNDDDDGDWYYNLGLWSRTDPGRLTAYGIVFLIVMPIVCCFLILCTWIAIQGNWFEEPAYGWPVVPPATPPPEVPLGTPPSSRSSTLSELEVPSNSSIEQGKRAFFDMLDSAQDVKKNR